MGDTAETVRMHGDGLCGFYARTEGGGPPCIAPRTFFHDCTAIFSSSGSIHFRSARKSSTICTVHGGITILISSVISSPLNPLDSCAFFSLENFGLCNTTVPAYNRLLSQPRSSGAHPGRPDPSLSLSRDAV